MKKNKYLAISLAITLFMVGCGKEDKTLQNPMDVIETIGNTEINMCCLDCYCESFETIEGIDNVFEHWEEIDFWIEVEDNELYTKFFIDIFKMGDDKAVEENNMEGLVNLVEKTCNEQEKIIEVINDHPRREKIKTTITICVYQDEHHIGNIEFKDGYISIKIWDFDYLKQIKENY